MHRIPSRHSSAYSLPPAADRDLPLQEEEALNLRDYWIVIVKYRWTIVTFLLAFLLIAVLTVATAPRPRYRATASIYLEHHSPNIMGVIGVSSAYTPTGVLDYYKTQQKLLESRTLAAQVIRDLGLDDQTRFRIHMQPTPSWMQRYLSVEFLMRQVRTPVTWLVRWLKERFKVGAEERQEGKEGFASEESGIDPRLINLYLSGLWVSPVPQTQLINVSFTSLNPSFSQKVANAHTTAFIRTSLLTRFELTTEARQFLADKLSELKAKLEKSEEQLNRFRKAHAIVPLERGESLVVERLRGLNADLTQARSKRIEAESLYRVVQQRDSRFLSQIIDSPVVRQIKDQISTLEVEKARLATTFKAAYPGVTALQEQIDQAKNRVDQEIHRIVRSIESDYAAAKAKERALTEEMEQARRAALDLREKAIEAAILEREVESDRSLYESVLKRTKETDLTGAVPISSIRVVDRADLPLRPGPVRSMRTAGLIVLVGLLGGVGLAFLRHYLDNTLKTPEDVERFLHLPTLGVMPNIGQLDRRANALGFTKKFFQPPRVLEGQSVQKGGLVIPYHPRSLASESYQAICTALLFSQPERPPRTILITSSQPKEGKTVTAINVAHTLARHGAPVLLIDADLRNGKCHRLLDVQNGGGLTNALAGHRNAMDLVKATVTTNLFLLSRGDISPNPAELLGSEKMRQLLESFETHFAFIIIDSAPLMPIIDSVLLSTKVDGVVLVTKGQTVSRSVARQACERLAYVRAKILGVILNHVDISGPEYRDYRKAYQTYYTAYTTDIEQS